MSSLTNFATRDGVTTIEINRPDERNALCGVLIEELISHFKKASEDPAARVIVLGSSGDKSFCAGADLKELSLATGTREKQQFFRRYARLIDSLAATPKPIITRIQGHAFGGGCGLVAASDIAIASEKASFCLPELRLGLAPMVIMAPLLRTVQRKALAPLVYSGEKFSAHHAKDIGLLSMVVDHEALESTVATLARTIADQSALAITTAKEGFTIAEEMPYRSALPVLADAVGLLATTEDGIEGVSAFLHKRQPTWKMR